MSGTPGDVPTVCQACAHGKFEHGIEGREQCSTCGCRGFFRPGATGCDNPSCANCHHTPGGHVPAPPASVVPATPATCRACLGNREKCVVSADGVVTVTPCPACASGVVPGEGPTTCEQPCDHLGEPWCKRATPAAPLLAAQRGPAHNPSDHAEYVDLCEHADCKAVVAQRGAEPVDNLDFGAWNRLVEANRTYAATIEAERATHAAETARLTAAIREARTELALGEAISTFASLAVAVKRADDYLRAVLAAEGLGVK